MLSNPRTPEERAKRCRQKKHRRSRQKARSGGQTHPMPRLPRTGPQCQRTQLLPTLRTSQEKNQRKTARTQAKGLEQQTKKETKPIPRRRRILPRKTLHPSHGGPVHHERKGACRLRAGETHPTGRASQPLNCKPTPELEFRTRTTPQVQASPSATPNNAVSPNWPPNARLQRGGGALPPPTNPYAVRNTRRPWCFPRESVVNCFVCLSRMHCEFRCAAW